jgi:hypothetical protein
MLVRNAPIAKEVEMSAFVEDDAAKFLRLDYSLVGENSRCAIERGLAEAD